METFTKSISTESRNRILSNPFILVRIVPTINSLSLRARRVILITKHLHPTDFERIIKPLIEREPLELGDDAESMDLDEEIGEIMEEKEEEAKQKRDEGPKDGEAKVETVKEEIDK